ncbi:BON domain-containing protein [Paraburkholderia sp.]|uniref:BON domain-containing protein n=1 Tax=Paraburkholderia sp. TaxID=1926495 RepID=UPI003D6E04F9
MKAIHVVKIVGSALVVLASLNAYAQASGTEGDASASMAPAASTKAQKKAVRTENRALQRKVRAALTKAGGISTANITVRARGGNVILQGSVPEQGQSDKATETAQGVAGVTAVKNDLAIRPQGQ